MEYPMLNLMLCIFSDKCLRHCVPIKQSLHINPIQLIFLKEINALMCCFPLSKLIVPSIGKMPVKIILNLTY